MACLCQTLEACGRLGDRPHVLLEDDWRRGRRTDDFREPSEMRGEPIALARIAHVLAQANGVEAILRGAAVPETLFTGAPPT
jgi:hypothetical protein